MNTLLIILIALIAGLVVFYYALPERFVAVSLYPMRRSSGLRLKSVQVDGDEWPYLEGGPESAMALVLLHGFGADKDNWTLYARYFTKAFRVIAPDLPGFGDNIKDPNRTYGATEQAQRLDRFFQAIGITGRFHIGGNSMGGYISLEYTLTHPERVLSLTLLDNAGVLAARKSVVELELDQGGNPFEMKSMADFDRMMRLVAYKPMYIPGVFKRVFLARARQQQAFLEQVMRAVYAQIETGAMNEKLPGVGAPTLIIWGRQDQMVDVSTVDVLTERIPDNRSVILEETGHVPMMERPRETAEIHISFLREVQDRRRAPA